VKTQRFAIEFIYGKLGLNVFVALQIYSFFFTGAKGHSFFPKSARVRKIRHEIRPGTKSAGFCHPVK